MRQDSLFNPEPKTQNQKPVKCLSLTFPNDEERRDYFLKKLREGPQRAQREEFERIDRKDYWRGAGMCHKPAKCYGAVR